jgi:hypothetical protein
MICSGWTPIINDALISRTFFLGTLALSGATGITGAIASYLFAATLQPTRSLTVDPNSAALLGGLLGLGAGLVVGMMLMVALDSAVAMVFVCFAEDPHALEVLLFCLSCSCYILNMFYLLLG